MTNLGRHLNEEFIAEMMQRTEELVDQTFDLA